MRYFLDRLVLSRSTPTALEYGLIALLIVATAIGVMHMYDRVP